MLDYGFKLADSECVHPARKCDMQTDVANLDLTGTAKSFNI